MEDQTFADTMTRLVAEHGKDALLGDKAKAYISDYKGQFTKEAEDFIKLLKADCGKIINEASNVLERKRQLVERMEDELRISPKYSMPLLDLLGLLLREDTTKCAEQPAPQSAAPQLAPLKPAPLPQKAEADEWFNKGEAAYKRKDYAEVYKWYHKAAEQGHAEAQYWLGYCYKGGLGLPKLDNPEAVKWYRKAAEQGHTEAQFRLGECYKLGWGVQVDYAQALEWLRRAAEKEHTEAINGVASLYYYGHGVPQSYAKAAEWYRKAAAQGDRGANSVLDGLKSEGKI